MKVQEILAAHPIGADNLRCTGIEPI